MASGVKQTHWPDSKLTVVANTSVAFTWDLVLNRFVLITPTAAAGGGGKKTQVQVV